MEISKGKSMNYRQKYNFTYFIVTPVIFFALGLAGIFISGIFFILPMFFLIYMSNRWEKERCPNCGCKSSKFIFLPGDCPSCGVDYSEMK